MHGLIWIDNLGKMRTEVHMYFVLLLGSPHIRCARLVKINLNEHTQNSIRTTTKMYTKKALDFIERNRYTSKRCRGVAQLVE